MNTKTTMCVSDEFGTNFMWVSNPMIGKLKDAQFISMSTDFSSGALLRIDNPFEAGAKIVIRSAKEVRGGNRVFFRHAVAGEAGIVTVTEVGLTVIRGQFKFVCQTTDYQFFTDGTSLVCHELEYDPDLHMSLAAFLIGADDLPHAIQYAEPMWLPGQVKWFDKFRLYGVIAGRGGDVFFHLNNVQVGIFNKPNPILSDRWSNMDFDTIMPKAGRVVRYEAEPSSEGSYPFKASWVSW